MVERSILPIFDTRQADNIIIKMSPYFNEDILALYHYIQKHKNPSLSDVINFVQDKCYCLKRETAAKIVQTYIDDGLIVLDY